MLRITPRRRGRPNSKPRYSGEWIRKIHIWNSIIGGFEETYKCLRLSELGKRSSSSFSVYLPEAVVPNTAILR